MFNLKCKRCLVVVGVVLICCINFIHLARADKLEVQQYIENTKAYIKEMFFTEDGLLNGTSKVHIDGGGGSIGIGSSFGNAGVDLPENSLVVKDKVGIGTDSPSLELEVRGASEITNDLTVDTETLYVDSSNDRVGIGTTNPNVKLNVRDSGKVYTLLGGGDEAGYGLETDDTEQWRMYTNSSDGDLEFALNDGSNNYETFVNFTKEGKVGIGTSDISSDTKVKIEDNNNEINIKPSDNDDNSGIDVWNKNEGGDSYIDFRIGSSSDYDGRIIYSEDSSFGDGGLGFLGGNDNNTDMFINKEGRVGIGTIDPKAKLDVNGRAKFGAKSNFSNLTSGEEYEINGGDYTIALSHLSTQRASAEGLRFTHNAYWQGNNGNGRRERRVDGAGISTVKVGTKGAPGGIDDGTFGVWTAPESGDINHKGNLGLWQEGIGNVGIGEYNPEMELDVSGKAKAEIFCFSNNLGCLEQN